LRCERPGSTSLSDTGRSWSISDNEPDVVLSVDRLDILSSSINYDLSIYR
jgi:hypothetical protein